MNPALPIVAFLIPTLYVWSLPVLAARCGTGKKGRRIDPNACFVADKRVDNSDSIGKGSVSGYISTPQATAAMAFVFLPTFLLWVYISQLLQNKWINATLASTILFFFLFLTIPIEKNPTIHGIVVGIFAAGSALFSIQVYVKTRQKLGHSPVDLAILLSLAGVSLVLIALSGVFRNRHVRVSDFGITWLFQAVAFTAVLFPMCFWIVKYSHLFEP